MSDVKDRFLRYIKIDTQSQEGTENVPSTQKQFDLARMLEQELIDMNASDVRLDEHCYLTATIPATDGGNGPVIGLISHIDTSDAVSGADVHAVVTENYRGGDIAMGGDFVLSPREYPELLHYIGDDIICSNGSTLLGSDDKAGVAEIMSLASWLLTKSVPEHGKIRLCFTPDEEVGRGVDYFDVKAFGADYAYTVDGGALGELSCENFNAAEADVSFRGVSIHPGSAKWRMVNASLVAMEFHNLLPRFMNPACTDGHEGFFHLSKLEGSVDCARAEYIIRDHDRALFERKKKLLSEAAEFLCGKYGDGAVSVKMRDSYYNMKEKIDPALVEAAERAMRAAGVEPELLPIRGGTDGARLSYMGLPCPNICTGGHNFHGRYEFVSVQSMEKVVEILKNLVLHS